MSELWFKPAYELAQAIRSRQLSPLELMQACLQRIEQVNPLLNAFIAMRPEEALADARATADRIARGEEVGLLAGLPFGVKELEDAEGFPSTHASVPYKDEYPERDSVQVERLKNAGAILLGKTNSPEFGYTAFTKNLLFGVTRNPWNPERTPGGSSGGTSAAIASGMVPLATGSDGGGSVRIPACFTGCFGLKPTFGRVPKGPFTMLGWNDTSVYGPITRTVRDAALFMDAVVGAHPSDPDSLPHPGYSYVDVLEGMPKGLRIAWSPTLGYARLQPDVRREAEEALQVFAKLGHEIEELDEEGFPDPVLAWVKVSSAVTYARIADDIEEHRSEFGRGFLAATERAAGITPEKYGKAQRERAKLVNYLWHLFESYDLLITPTLPIEAFDARGRGPARVDGEQIENPLQVVAAFTYPFNLSGHPAGTVRAGLTDSGLPCGLQIVAPRHREELILQLAYAYERERPWNDVWPREIAATV